MAKNSLFSAAVQLFLKGVTLSFAGMVVLGIINYLIRRHLALHLSRVDFGFFYSMFAFFGMLTAFCQFGVKHAGAILTASCLAKGQEKRISCLLSSLMVFSILLGVIFMLAVFLCREWLAVNYFKYSGAALVIVVFSPFVLLNPVWSILLSIPHGQQEFPVYNGLFVGEMLLVFAGVLLFAGKGVLAMAAAWVVAMAIAAGAALWLICHRYHLRPSLRMAACHKINLQIWHLCSWIAVSATGLTLLSFLDSVFLTWLGNLEQVAAYNIALPIIQILQSLTVIPLVFLPFSTKMWEEKKFAELSRIFRWVNLLFLLGTVPLVLLMHLLGPGIITLLFGKPFISSAPALTILSGGILFFVAGQFNLNFLNASGRQRTGTFIVTTVLLTDAVLNFLLIPKFGILGAAAALSGSYLITDVLSYFFSDRELKLRKTPAGEVAK